VVQVAVHDHHPGQAAELPAGAVEAVDAIAHVEEFADLEDEQFGLQGSGPGWEPRGEDNKETNK